MKQIPNLIAGSVIFATILGCKKHNATPPPPPTRTIQYQLYTTQDFSTVKDSITFQLSMRDGATVIFDSTLAPMRISEIPDNAHQILFKKPVPAGHEKSDLVVGFLYEIKDIGSSWFLDSSKAGSTIKIIDYNFH